MSDPSYLIAADNHTILNSTPDDFTDTILGIPKFVALGAGAAVTEILNVPITVGNWLGGDFERIDYKKELQSFDSDLSKYYTEHKLGVDTLGFIAGSLVPGMAGVKVLRGGQAVLRGAIGEGVFGENIGSALGLLAPETTTALADAVAAIRTTGNVFKLGEANTLRALATGAGQATLESFAFETAVAATMYKSPILDQMNVSDLGWNVAIGTGLGGVLGGVFTGIGTAYTVARAGAAAEAEMRQFTARTIPNPNAPASSKILYKLNQIDDIDGSLNYLHVDSNVSSDLLDRAAKTAAESKQRLWTDIRAEFGNLAKTDKAVAEALYQSTRVNGMNKNLGNLLDAEVAGRVSVTTSTEKELNAISRKLAKNHLLTPEETAFYADRQVSFIRLHGEDMGSVTHSRPGTLSVTDHLNPEDTIELVKNGIKIGKQTIGMDNNPHMPFNMFGADHLRVEARYWWAEKLPKWVDDMVDPIQVHATDIPLLEKAYRDGLERLSVIPEGQAIKDAITINGKEEIKKFIVSQKVDIGQRLLQTVPTQISPAEFIDKFKGLFGINFNLINELDRTYYGFFGRMKGKGGFDIDKAGNQVTDLTADYIAIDQLNSLVRPLASIMRTLKHEEGHRIFQALIDANGITLNNISTRWPLLYTEVRKIGNQLRPDYYKPLEARLQRAGMNLNDIPPSELQNYTHKRSLMHEYFADTFYYLSANPKKLDSYPAVKQAIGHLINPIPQEVLDSVAKRATRITPQEAAKIVNVESKWLDGSAQREGGEFARDLARKEYREYQIASGVRESELLEDPLRLPMYAKIISKNEHVKIDGNEITGLAKVMQGAVLYDKNARILSTQILGEVLPSIADKNFIVGGAGGPGLLSSAEGNYGSLPSILQYVGQRSHAIIKKWKEVSSEIFTPTLSKLANDMDSAIEWSVLNEKMRNLPQKYHLSEDGKKLVYGKEPVEDAFDDYAQYQKAMEKYSQKIAEARAENNIPMEIPIKSELVQKLVADHIDRNGFRIGNRKLIRAAEGLQDNLDPTSFYPIPRNPKDTPHFAYVVDDRLIGNNHSKMIYAADAEKLETMINEIKTKVPELKVFTGNDANDYFKAHGNFEFERTINENSINDMLVRRGASSSYLPITDPSKIVNHFLEWHLARDAAGVREAVSHNYSRQFESLRESAAGNLNAATSTIGYSGPMHAIESMVDNPATNLIKMALDIQKTAEYPLWSGMNRMLDRKFSEIYAKAGASISNATSPAHLEAISDSLKKAGYEGITNISDGMYRAMNGTVPRGALTSFVNKANGLLATFALRMDPLNALNNIIGQNVLLGTEIKSVTDAIRKGNPQAVGELANLMQVKVPGMDDIITSPLKLIGNAINNYHVRKDLREFYKKNGFISLITDQYDQTLDALALSATDTIASFEKKLGNALSIAKRVGDSGEKLTANTFAEEFNRFVAADVMRQITDVAVKHNLMDSSTALTYINTFVNRTQGNFLASQRPMMFQGAVGQAIGLFQTYQFNLIQQMTRHIGEGQLKNVGMMMGLQGTIYGANGMPGFSALNTHIIGSAPGNTDHTDMYRAIYNGAGKEWGDWMMYGFGSNWLSIFNADLKNNLYTRGDINPRNISIIPTSPADIPIVQASAKLLGNIKETMGKIADGGNVWQSILRGVEQNGVSRPLAGMAQVLSGATSDTGMVTSMSSKGNMLMAHDLTSLASLTRIAGGKPLDEALTNDAMFRFNSYKAADALKKATLGEAIKLTILGDKNLDDAQVQKFTEAYLKAGGQQDGFSKFMTSQYKNATVSQANQLRERLSNPYNQSLQEVMGGMRLQDLSGNSELGVMK